MGIERSETFPRAWRTYIETTLLLETRLEEDMRATAGMTLAEFNVLLLLSEAPTCRMRMGHLADRMVFSPSRLTYQVKSMEKRGLVLRQTSAEDKRVHEVVLTAIGLERFREAGEHHAATVQNLFDGIVTEEELVMLERLFSRLRGQLTQDSSGPGSTAQQPDPPS
ncbi:MarR family winged helix-turn-helix transcriptional regulator [Nocardiopsis salina]|uniref:MarR family winged helix-turn-helix transcriptional regulator n=1 Tax=Nocardiopsis salina TaxID=245836 RepID=UPI000346547E|nr:MarR family winged helix-turn-helix transcriptional regulator [Nocardiopsis salina]